MSQDLDLSLLPLVFSLFLTVASRLLHLYSTNDKASSLMTKSFSTVSDTQRSTQSYMEKRRWKREIEVTGRRKGGIKRGESKLASNHFLCALHSLDPSEMLWSYTEKRRVSRRQRWPGG